MPRRFLVGSGWPISRRDEDVCLCVLELGSESEARARAQAVGTGYLNQGQRDRVVKVMD